MNLQPLLWAIVLSLTLHLSTAQPVPLQQPTAMFSQDNVNDYSITQAIDGIIAEDLGWAIWPMLQSATAVFETANDIGFTNGTLLRFTLHQSHLVSVFGLNDSHNLGRFRLSITTDDRETFADGLPNNGDVDANWIVLDPISFISGKGTTLTELEDYSILASGPNPSTDIYTVTAILTNTGITGVRLEALQDPSLPSGGPGRRENGNFVLTEFQLEMKPVEPAGGISIHCAAEICWLSKLEKRYQVQFISSVDSQEWLDLGLPVQGTGNEICVYDSTRSKEKRFYRYVEVQ